MDYLLELQKHRRANLKRLVADYPTQREFGEAAGLSVAQISHILTEVRGMGEEVARRIEGALGLPLGWMDRADPDREPAPDTLPAALPADQAKLLTDYARLSPQHQAMIRETAAAYLKLERDP